MDTTQKREGVTICHAFPLLRINMKEVLHIVGKLPAALKVQNEVMILSLCPHFNRNVQIFTVIRQENCPFLAIIFLFFDF